jgi:plastocyanin
MRRRTAFALASALGGTLLAPAVLATAGEPPPAMKQPLVAQLEATPNPVSAGEKVAFDASKSRGVSDNGARYSWDLDGDGSLETDTGALPKAEATPDAPGTVVVRVRVEDADGQADEQKLSLEVTKPVERAAGDGESDPAPPAADDPPKPLDEPRAGGASSSAPEAGDTTEPPQPNGPATPNEPATASPDEVPTASALMATPVLKTTPHAATRSQVIRAAGSSGVSMSNFAFSPASVSVNVGDSVTWTNHDSAPHNAKGPGITTPNLKKGQSASVTFSKAGTFSYICTIHPSMHGKVIVASASSSGSGGSDSGSGDTSGGSADDSASADTGGLPQTGLAIASVVLVGLLLMGSGELMRRLTPGRR